jgi:hypothetical protein
MRIELPAPHAGQRVILADRSRFVVVRCGRRFGKTVLGEIKIAPAAIQGHPCGWFAPTYKYLDEPWRDFNRFLAPIITSSSKQDRRIELLGGGSVDFWTMDDPNCGRSRKYKEVVIDEAQHASVRAYTHLYYENDLLDIIARSECLAGTQGVTTPILACFDEDAGVPIIDEDGKPDIVYPDGMRASWHDAMAKMWDSLAEEVWDAN